MGLEHSCSEAAPMQCDWRMQAVGKSKLIRVVHGSDEPVVEGKCLLSSLRLVVGCHFLLIML